jgi:hypothetical protein
MFAFQPFVIPAKSLFSLRDAVIGRLLGQSLEPYVLCLRQLANSLAYMHSRRIILCDFAPDTVYIESQSSDHKMLKVRFKLLLFFCFYCCCRCEGILCLLGRRNKNNFFFLFFFKFPPSTYNSSTIVS